MYWSYSGRRDGDILHHAVGTFTDLDAAIDALETWLLLDSRVVNVPMAYSPTFVTLSSVKPFFFHGLQNA